jgi:hypothetical protein
MNKVLFKAYESHVKSISQRVKNAATAPFHNQNLPVVYLNSGDTNTDATARRMAVERNITAGDVCILTALEMAPSYVQQGIRRVNRRRKTLALYHYSIDPEFGWMYARIQTWFPFTLHVYVKGREWLSRQMDQAGLGYIRQDHCFPWIEDYGRAQQLLDHQLKTHWTERLLPWARRLNPLHPEIFRKFEADYYWTVPPCAWAPEVVFQPGPLQRDSPRFLEHGLLRFSRPDVLRFFGQRVTSTGKIPPQFDGEIQTDFRSRPRGDRIKHRINGNSLKGYGKASLPGGDLFRVETTTNQIDDFRAFRPKEGGPEDALQGRPLRYGVADLHRRTEISQKANERYLDALSTIDDTTRLCELVRILEPPRPIGTPQVRALHPFSAEDHALLEAVNRGEFALNGLRNRDLPNLLYKPGPITLAEKRRRSAAVTRKLRLLRAHGLIQKVPHTHRYQVTSPGRLAITAILTADRSSLSQLSRIAA